MNSDEVAARVAIQDRVHSYAVLLDTGKFADLGALFAPDAILKDSYGTSTPGPEGVVAYLKSAIAVELPPDTPRPRFMRHNITSHRVRMVDRSSASADTYFIAVTDHGPDHWGRYRDTVVRLDGVWCFADRAVIVEGHATPSWYAGRAAAGEAARR